MWKSARVSPLTVGPAQIDFCEPLDAADAIVARELIGAVHLCNAYTLALADERGDLASALAKGSARLPDGMPLVWWARRRGIDVSDRVYGPTLMEQVLDRGRAVGLRHFLYGSTPEVLEALSAAIARRWPGVAVGGVESPPFREVSDAELTESIAVMQAVETSVGWVGMGTPKQDLLCARMASIAPDITFVAIGAAFDFLAGTKSQAPRWMQRAGLEWLYRLITEPRRLWKRYLVYNTKFVRLLWRDHRNT